MKIAMVTCSAFPFHNSGVAYVVHNMAKELTKMGHEAFVIGLSQEATTINYSGYQVIGVKIPGASHNFNNSFKETDYNNPIGATMLEAILKETRPDIVHFHSLNGLGATMVKTAKSLGCKTVVTMHDWWWMCPSIQTGQAPLKEDYIIKRSAYLKKILKNHTDLIIPVSDYVESFLEPNGITHTKVITIPNGVEPYENQDGRHGNNSSNNNAKPITFGFLGGKHQLKGYDLLIEACSDLDESYRSDYEVHVHGTLQMGAGALKKVLNYLKGGKLKELASKIKRHMPHNKQNKDSPIIYHPLFAPEEKDQVYENIDVLLSLSKVKESSSLVVREALIRGIPVITTPSGGPEEVIIQGKNGIILKEPRASELKDAMEQIIKTKSLKDMEAYIQGNPYTYTTQDQAERTLAAYERCFYT